MYSRDEMKALTDQVLNIAKAEAVEVDFTGGERSGAQTNSISHGSPWLRIGKMLVGAAYA